MRIGMGAIVVASLIGSSALGQREFGFDNRKGSGQPYLKPEETVARMKVTEGFEAKLFAAEPQLVNPIAMTVDEKGRVWVVECFEYPKRTPKGKMPRDRVKILEDTDGDGVCDKTTVFIEGKDFPVPFDMASGIEVGHGGVYLGAPPYLFFIENKNDKPGKIETLLKGFGSHDTHETLNTFQWGPDGRLYGLHGVFTHSEVKPGQADGPATRLNAAVWRFDPFTKKFEIFSEGTSNPWGMDWRNSDGQFILCCCVIPHLYHMVPGGNYKRQAGQSFNAYAYGEIKEICDHTFHKESGWAHAGLISLDTPLMPERLRNSVVFGSIHGCSIKQNILKPVGSSFVASRGEDFLVSGDKNFRPINLRWGPNGEIYCIDWHDQNPCHQTKPDDWDYERGRVYRIQLTGTKTQKPTDFGKKSHRELADLLDDKNPYVRRTALRLLLEARTPDTAGMNAAQAIMAVEPNLIAPAAVAIHRRGADGKLLPVGRQEIQALLGPTFAKAPALRRQVVRHIAEVSAGDDRVFEELVRLAEGEKDPTVRREWASAAVRLADDRTPDVRPLVHKLLAVKDDAADPIIPQLLWLAYEKVLSRKDGAATPVREELRWLQANAPGNPLISETIVPRAMRRLIAGGQPEDLSACIAFLGECADPTVRTKALDAIVSTIGNRKIPAPPEWATVRKSLADSGNTAIMRLADSLAVKFSDPAAVAKAVATVRNGSRSTAERIDAVRDLGTASDPSTLGVLFDVGRPSAPAELQAEVVRALSSFDSSSVSKELLKSWKERTPAIRSEIVNVLTGRKDWAGDLLKAVADKTVDRTELNDNAVTRIQSLRDRGLAEQVEKVWGKLRTTPADLQKIIDTLRTDVSTKPGSFARGKIVFDNQCAKCHKFDGRGHEVGPGIEGAGRDIEYLLANVLDPNRVIGAPYFRRTVNLLNARVESGILQAEDAQSITLKTENGVLKQIQRKDIDDIKVEEKSLMPEGLGNNMTAENFRDLIRYTMAHPFLTEFQRTVADGSDAAPLRSGTVHGPVGGRIELSAPANRLVRLTTYVTVPADMTVRLLVGSRTDYQVRAASDDGDINAVRPVTGKGSADDLRPDQSAVEMRLQKGRNRIVFTTRTNKDGEAVYLRIWDPNRQVKQADFGP